MNPRKILLTLSIFLYLIPSNVFAEGRTETVQEIYTEHIWVVTGLDGMEFCRIITGKPVPPQPSLIKALCGQLVYDQVNEGKMVVRHLLSRDISREVERPLPGISISLYSNHDTNDPKLFIRARDLLEGERIIQIEARINDQPVVCAESPCEIPMYNKTNARVEYWATSSYGDTSDQHVALVRIAGGEITVIGDKTYTGWLPSDRVPRIWSSFPPVFLPGWLKNAGETQLFTDIPYTYLAGQTILSGALGVSDCENLGIIPGSGGYANQCGLEFAREKVTELQNAYNHEIAEAAYKSGVPSRILKGIIAQESQFWPEAHGIAGEKGLYQLSRDGADTLLRWNGHTYLDYCRLYLERCDELGYDSRQDWERELLISAVMKDADSIALLGEILIGKAAQVARVLENYFDIDPAGEVLTYETLWMLTIANYNAGPNLIAGVLWEVDRRGLVFTWENIGAVMNEMQPSVYKYVRNITIVSKR